MHCFYSLTVVSIHVMMLHELNNKLKDNEAKFKIFDVEVDSASSFTPFMF